jgi:hypothetical protein
MYIRFPLILVALNAVIALSSQRGSAYALLIISVVIGLICCTIGYGLRCFVKKEYTVLATPAGNLLIARDGKHDQIVRELQKRRVDALKKAAFVNPLAEHWREIKKFKWLRDEGIISDGDFKQFRETILSSGDASVEKAAESPVLH